MIGFIGSRISEWASCQPAKIAFFENAKPVIDYLNLNLVVQCLRSEYDGQNLDSRSAVAIYLPHGASKAIGVTSLLGSEIPGLALSTQLSRQEVRSILGQLPFNALLTTPTLAKRLALTQDCVESEVLLPYSQREPLLLIHLRPRQARIDSNFAWLLLTSGSTGKPKAVKLSWSNLWQRTQGEIQLFGMRQDSCVLNVLSFAHDLGLNQLLCGLCIGASLDIFTAVLPVDLLRSIQSGSYCGFTATPLIWSSLLALVREPSPQFDGYLSVSGGKLATPHLQNLLKSFPDARVIKTYGQTETFRTLAEDRPEKILSENAGRIIDGVQAILWNDRNERCSVGEIGEMIHFGAGAMSGYWQDEALTATKLIKLGSDCGIQTGDHFKLLADGEYQFIGRRDDMVKRMDHRIYIAEVEDLLRQSGLVSDVCVVKRKGVDRWRTDETQLIAFVTAHRPNPNLQQELEAYCLRSLTSYKVPDTFHVIDSMPTTHSQKPDSRQLIDRLEREGL